MKIRPDIADKGDKGGRGRYIPIRTESQRSILNHAEKVANNGSMIPPGKTYKQHAKSYDKATDREARQTIAEEFVHSRPQITNVYLDR